MPATSTHCHHAAPRLRFPSIFRCGLSGSVARALAVSSLLILLAGPLPVHAITWTWSNTTPGGADWKTGGNWSTGQAPTNTGYIEIENGGTALLNGTANNIGGHIGTIGNGSAVVGAGGAWNITNAGLIVGSSNTGSLKIRNGGIVTTLGSAIGKGTASDFGNGLLEVDGVGSIYTQSRGTFYLGQNNALGTLNITNGGKVNLSSLYSGYYGLVANSVYKFGEGVINVQGAGSILELSSDSYTGLTGGKGTLNITNGGVVKSKDTPPGGTAIVNDNYLGNGGSYDTVGWRPSEGYATVSGVGSQWISNGMTYVGIAGGKGELTVSNGGSVNNSTVGTFVGKGGDTTNSVFTGSQGKLTVTGAGSTYAAGYWFSFGGSGGRGELRILDGATVTSANATVGESSPEADKLGHGTALVDAATWNAGLLYVGYSGGIGALTLQNGGKITSTTGMVGIGRINGLSGVGTAIIDGDGASWSTSLFAIGDNGGQGTVTVRNGALLTTGILYLGTPYLAHSADTAFSNGTLNLLSGAVLEVGVIYKGDGVARVNIDGGIVRKKAGTTGGDLTLGFFSAPNFVAGDWTLGAGGVTFDTQTSSIRLSAPLGGTGGLTKQGSGYLDLSGTNTYAGATHVTAGRLVVSGSIAASSLTTVDAGATIEGAGIIGALDLHGKISPGGERGVASMVTGDATFHGQSSMDYEIIDFNGSTGTGWDFLNIDGSLTLDSSSSNLFTVKLKSVRPLGEGENVYNFGLAANFDKNQNYLLTMLTATDGIVGWDDMVFALDASGFTNVDPGTWSIGKNGNSLELRYTAIPEPSALAMGLLGTLALGMRRHRARTV